MVDRNSISLSIMICKGLPYWHSSYAHMKLLLVQVLFIECLHVPVGCHSVSKLTYANCDFDKLDE